MQADDLDTSTAVASASPAEFMPAADTPPPASADTSGIVFTDAAAGKVRELLHEEDDPDQVLRVFVTGGGCSGFKYGFNFDAKPAEDDTAVTTLGVTLVVDPMSLQYLEGAAIDYKETAEGAQFVIRNPNASTTCGCGSSFSV